MSTKLRIGIVGCGDFLRLQENEINKSHHIEVAALFDPAHDRCEKFASKWPGSRACQSAEEVLDAPDVDIAAIFVPPWARKDLFVRAAKNGKRIITTKPFASTIAECDEMVSAVKKAGVAAGVIYNRTESRMAITLKQIFESGRFGKLALFKQDWIHHYPQWNTWALDPQKNGGPFMDAMIHNLNIARYLMGRPATRGTMFSDKHAHPDLACADTEFLKLDFTENGSAHLFITWAADLRVDSHAGNYREHVDIWYAVTDQGWKLTEQQKDGAPVISATKDGKIETIPFATITETAFDALAAGKPDATGSYGTLASVNEATEDIRIIRRTGANLGALTELS